jgi:hypothetical protein
MAARLMGDSTTPGAVPEWVDVKCFYVDGSFAASAEQIAAWHGPRVMINVTGDPAHGGNVLDVERGDATPDHVAAWFDARLAAGVSWPGVYCNRDQFGAVTANLGHRNAARWLATLDGKIFHTFDGIALAACQFAGAQLTGANFDLSLVFAGHWHPNWDAEIPNPEIANLARLGAIAQTDLGRLVAAIKHL